MNSETGARAETVLTCIQLGVSVTDGNVGLHISYDVPQRWWNTRYGSKYAAKYIWKFTMLKKAAAWATILDSVLRVSPPEFIQTPMNPDNENLVGMNQNNMEIIWSIIDMTVRGFATKKLECKRIVPEIAYTEYTEDQVANTLDSLHSTSQIDPLRPAIVTLSQTKSSKY